MYCRKMSTGHGHQKRSNSRSSSISSGIESSCSPTHVTFSCGCGECSILGYLTNDKVCPSDTPPAITMSTQDPSYPEDMVTETEMSYTMFTFCLGQETEKIHEQFCVFVSDTFKELLRIPFDDLKEYTFNLLVLHQIQSVHDTGLTMVNDLNELRRLILLNFTSWYNYELILRLRR